MPEDVSMIQHINNIQADGLGTMSTLAPFTNKINAITVNAGGGGGDLKW